MKRLFYLYTLLILAGCTDMSVNDIYNDMNEEFQAFIEDNGSRTYIDEQIRMRWTAEDRVTLFRKNTYNREYMFTGKTGANAGGFRQISTDDDFWFGYDVAANYAIYPHSADTELDETELYITYNMPSEQTYVENSFGLGANVMVAVADNSQLLFKNVGSYLRVRLYGENVSVSSITLTSKGGEAIAGKAKITPTIDGNPTCEMIGNGQSVRLVCPTPVTISSDANNPTDFWIVVPPVTFSKGFSVTVENSDGETQVFDVDKSVTFKRNSYNNLAREVKITPYLTFTADSEQTLTMWQAVETLEYSVNGSEWKELGRNEVTFGGNHGKLQIRGKSKIGTIFGEPDFYQYNRIIFGNTTKVSCSGDIRTLVDYENYATANTINAIFAGLFEKCTSLTTAPELPATTLALGCYSSMFKDCTSLTTAPELPATTLAYYSYESMFEGCTKLKNITMLATSTINAYRCFYNWVKGVALTGTFTKAKNMTSLSTGIHGIPEGWTVKNYSE